jgi:DinB family protein
MTHSQWFCEQLTNSMTGFGWAVECLAPEHWYSSPPRPNWLGQWSLARHVFHMQYQERYVVQVGIKDLLHLSPFTEERPKEEDAWQQEQRSVQELLQQFQTFRCQTSELISHLIEDEWEKPREKAYWNDPLTLQWIITKAWQHTLEHTHEVLRLHLFWAAATYLDAHPEEIH